MRDYFIWGGIALCLFALYQLARRDWVRLQGMTMRVNATVMGHRKSSDGDGISYAAIFAFSAEGKEHEVIDQMLSAKPAPPIGTMRELTYPFGRPDLARVPRPLMWLAVYVFLIGLTGMLFAVERDWLK